MKTEQEIKDIISTVKVDLLEAHQVIKECISNEDWEGLAEYSMALMTGACIINAAIGIIE